MELIVLELAQKFPFLVAALSVVGVLRLINKPLFTFLRAVVDATPSAKDNEALDKVEKSKAYASVQFVLDWLGSIKLPAKK